GGYARRPGGSLRNGRMRINMVYGLEPDRRSAVRGKMLEQVAVAGELTGAAHLEDLILGRGLGRADMGSADRAVRAVFDQPGATLQEVPLPEVGPAFRAGHDGHHLVLLSLVP